MTAAPTTLPRLAPEELARRAGAPLPDDVVRQAERIVDEVTVEGEPALRRWAEQLDGLAAGASMTIDRSGLIDAHEALPIEDRQRLERVAGRIRRFSEAQRSALVDVDLEIAGGRAGHRFLPMAAAGCYAPGGRYPLPSSVLMTAIPARVAGVESVWVASPRPAPITLAAAAVAGADGLLAVGGAQAIAALAAGVEPIPACDVVVGPGNSWVTAAKRAVSSRLTGRVAIDMLAGPSELLILADESAHPDIVAADLLAQAEHAPDARPMLLSTTAALVDAVEEALVGQLADLPTADVARRALANGGAAVCASREELTRWCDRIGPEHLQFSIAEPWDLLERCRHYGAAFLGEAGGEVLGDYGAGPNHVLPTGGTARQRGGLSVLDFLTQRTWLEIERPDEAVTLVDDAVWLARAEGLEGHARAAERRRR